MRMLFPKPVAAVDPRSVYADVPHNDRRPSVRLNMVVSVDGGTSWNGVSGALGGSADKALFAVLRSLADVVLVASGTMREEHYGPAVLGSEIQDRRLEQGQTPVPKIAVVSHTCQFDWSTTFFTAAAERPIVITVSSAAEADRTRAAELAEVIIAGEDDVDLSRAIAELGSRGATSVLVRVAQRSTANSHRPACWMNSVSRSHRYLPAATRNGSSRGRPSIGSSRSTCARSAKRTATCSCAIGRDDFRAATERAAVKRR